MDLKTVLGAVVLFFLSFIVIAMIAPSPLALPVEADAVEAGVIEESPINGGVEGAEDVKPAKFTTVNTQIYGATDKKIKIHDNESAENQNLTTVLNFLFVDHTEKMNYNDTFQCGEFAAMLHDNAEKAGIRCGFVRIWFKGEEVGHACCAFEIVGNDWYDVTRNGVLYIDCNNDKCYAVFDDDADYQPYCLNSIFKQVLPEDVTDGTYFANYEYDPMGIVRSYSTVW